MTIYVLTLTLSKNKTENNKQKKQNNLTTITANQDKIATRFICKRIDILWGDNQRFSYILLLPEQTYTVYAFIWTITPDASKLKKKDQTTVIVEWWICNTSMFKTTISCNTENCSNVPIKYRGWSFKHCWQWQIIWISIRIACSDVSCHVTTRCKKKWFFFCSGKCFKMFRNLSGIRKLYCKK